MRAGPNPPPGPTLCGVTPEGTLEGSPRDLCCFFRGYTESKQALRATDTQIGVRSREDRRLQPCCDSFRVPPSTHDRTMTTRRHPARRLPPLTSLSGARRYRAGVASFWTHQSGTFGMSTFGLVPILLRTPPPTPLSDTLGLIGFSTGTIS